MTVSDNNPMDHFSSAMLQEPMLENTHAMLKIRLDKTL